MQDLGDDLVIQATTSDNTRIVDTEEFENPIVEFIVYILVWGIHLLIVMGLPWFVWTFIMAPRWK